MKNRFLVALLFALSLCWRTAAAADSEPVWEVRAITKDGEVEYHLQAGVWEGSHGVQVKYGETTLTADQLQLDQNSGQVDAAGSVVLQREGHLWKGDQLHYNFKTKEIQADRFRMGKVPYFVQGYGLSGGQSNGVYHSYYSAMTTDDVADPSYSIHAQTMIISPGKYIEARNATFYVGKTPVLYWPYYRRALNRHPNNWVITPGYRSLYGPYLLNSYHWYLTDNIGGTVDVDYRQKRGVGGGPQFFYDAGALGKGEFRYYFTRDDEPGLNSLNKTLDRDRSLIQFSHQVTLRTNLTALAVVNYQSDEYFTRDFFERQYRTNTQPATFLEVNQTWPNFSLDLLAQPRVDDFFDTVERLPDIKLSAIRQQLGNSPLYYESESSIGYYRREFGISSVALPAYSAFRSDTFHQVVLPQTYFGWLNFVPRVGGRWTHYGQTDGYGSTFTEQDRGVFNTGAEVSFKASHLWRDTSSKFFEVDGIRHIIEPSINYVYVPTPNVQPNLLPQFDSELPSFRLLPIVYPDYNNIDSIDSENVLRFSLRNRLQTKRGDDVDDLLNWALYTDWRLHPRAGQGTFADVFSDMDFKPKSWLIFTSQARYNISNGEFDQSYHTATIQPNNVWSMSLGHRYLRDDPTLGLNSGQNTIFTTFYFRLNENWATRVSHVFEARDGVMQEQYYTLYRDLRSWTTALTLRLRDNKTGPTDVTIAVTISLKAFPRFGLGSDRVNPSLLLGS